MDKRTHAFNLTTHISGLMARLESAHDCCFHEISATHAAIQHSVTRASDSNNTGRLLFYSNLIGKAVDALEMDACHE